MNLPKPLHQPLRLKRTFLIQKLSCCFRKSYLRLWFSKEISTHHHCLTTTHLQITAPLTFECRSRLLARKSRSDSFCDGLAHLLGKEARFRQGLAICQHDLHHITDRVDSFKRSL